MIKGIHDLEIYSLLGKLVARVCHELATPICNIEAAENNIKTYIYKKDIDLFKEKNIDKLAVAQKYLRNLNESIKPLLEVKKEIAKLFIEKTIKGIEDTYKNSKTYNNINFSLKNLDYSINGFEADIYAIFHNLIDNSYYWASKKKVILHISIWCEEEDSSIKIHYKDNGPGASKIIIKNMFDVGTTMKSGGSGLGLAVIKSLLHRIDATIEYIDDNQEEGAHFCIVFPKDEGENR